MFITHDLGVIAEVADRVAVMYLGRVVDLLRSRSSFAILYIHILLTFLNPCPVLVEVVIKNLKRLGTVPIPINLPNSCPFMPRCEQAIPGICDKLFPPWSKWWKIMQLDATCITLMTKW